MPHNDVTLSYEESCRVAQEELNHLVSLLKPAIDETSDYSFAQVPLDARAFAQVQELVSAKRLLNPTLLVVVGIGGSNLGARALHEALHGTLYNELSRPMRVYWADTVDADYSADIAALIERELRNDGTVIINVISKSGATTETIANLGLFIEILKEHRPDSYHEYVVATTDEGSALWDYAQRSGYACLKIPKDVGGRYSVFTPVGLFPLGLLGIDIRQLLYGAQQANIQDAARSAAIIYAHYKQGKTVHDFFLFSVACEALGKWYRQLFAESLGKNSFGMTPTVSIGSADLHSMVQLYLGGADTRITSFVTIGHTDVRLHVPHEHDCDSLVPSIGGKSFAEIMYALTAGTQHAYLAQQRPFMKYILAHKTPQALGMFMQMQMYTVVYMGHLLGINPFDQPAVELYKKETRRLLAHE